MDEVNYDESKVPAYTLPDPLTMENGQRVTSKWMWQTQRRPELITLFEDNVYGRSPGRTQAMEFELCSTDLHALNDRAIRKEVTVWFTGDRAGPSMTILLYVPRESAGPVPAFLGLNFRGNQSVHADPGITITDRYVHAWPDSGIVNNRATPASRASEARRWPIETLVDKGYALATVYCGDLEPDDAQGWEQGVRGHFLKPGQSQPAPDDWGAVAAWAWGLSRAMDYLETDSAIDLNRVAVVGHSRLGKAAVWAGALDERFAMMISNESGCVGARISRRRFGETVAITNRAFPHWFCGNFHRFGGNEDQLPIDQHQALALVAPRPIYVASAAEDLWCDPKGEFVSAKGAEPVYELFEKKGLGAQEMPPLDHPIGDTIGYHIRSGPHDIIDYDWAQYIKFADRHLRR